MKVLLVSEAGYLKSDIRGGVQLCTDEYIRYIGLAGYEVELFPVTPSINILNRVKIKFGLDTYNHYDIAPYADKLAETIKASGINVVFLNQVNLSGWVAQLKGLVPADVKFIGLSHGNESADYLNDITKPGKTTALQTWKLGKLLVKENEFFSHLLDGLIVLSEQEIAINNWLGANNVLYLPRLLSAGFIDWKPTANVAGFAGTLDHLPNLYGVRYLANALKERGFKGKLRIVGGPPSVGKQYEKDYPFVSYAGPIDDRQLVEEVATWSVFLNPVFWYARGASTKLAQAINWGLPCITTPAGRRGYQLADDSIVSNLNTPESFAAKLIATLANEKEVTKLKAASERNASEFNAEPYIKQLKDFVNAIVNDSI
jgi:glycosyltransferase involved in cell wall biosynthesis